MKKKLSLLIVLITIISVSFVGANGLEKTPTTTETASRPEVSVHFIDVGQADSIFVDYGDYDILIDGGNNEDGQLVVDYLKSLNTDDIEILVATHPHEDHIGGLDDVISAFDVETIIDSGYTHTTKTYEDYLNAALAEKETGAKVLQDDDMVFDLAEGIKFEIIESGDDFEDELNNYSVVSKLTYNDIEFLFTGDMETEAEKNILERNIQADILKVAHHGSSSSSNKEFLTKVSPEVAILSYGVDNSYGHPHLETLASLGNYVNKIYDTANNGHIVVTTDGVNYEVKTQKGSNNIIPAIEAQKPVATQVTGVSIKNIDLDAEIVTIVNNASSDVDMTGWKLLSVKGNQAFDFPAGYMLKAGASVKVVSGRGSEGDGVSTLKWTGSYIWNNDGDPGVLYDSAGKEISRF